MVKNRLKEIRMREYMLNKKEFAAMLEINYPQYIRYENGTVPYMEIAFKIAVKLNKKVDDIFYYLED